MLNILLHSDIGEVVAVVTRYFGGIKLGTGGLVKAYQGAVAHAMEILPSTDKIIYAHITLCCDYDHINLLYYHLPQFNAKIISENFLERITYIIELPAMQKDIFIQTFTNAANGKIQIINQIIPDS